MSYQQLTLDERYRIQVLHKQRFTQRAIAGEIGRDPSTISRELRRNVDPSALVDPYLALRAARYAQQRRIDKGRLDRKIQGKTKLLVEQKLRLSWSPEQISGRLQLEHSVSVSHETIYQHVLRDSMQRGVLRYCLRFGGYKHSRFKKSTVALRTRQRKNWLDQRPKGANERTEIGHWERDCVLGTRGTSALLTIIDRRSRYTRIRHVPKLSVEHVANATLDALRPYRRVTKTMTNDNGIEFQRDESLQTRMGIPIFFCDPGSPWQRGSIENLNGLVRQYLPKSHNLDALPPWVPTALEETLNFRPRKILGYRTPHEIFFDDSVLLTSSPLLRFGLEFSPIS
jgi:IS30 family transposase